MSDRLEFASQAFAPFIGVAPLMRLAFANEDIKPIGEALLKRAEENITDANALMDCSVYLQIIGHHDLALAMQAQAIKTQALYSIPAKKSAPGIKLLVIMGPGDLMSNTPIEFLIEDSDVALDILYLSLDANWPEIVPEHDVMLVGIAESESNQALLKKVGLFIANWPRPVINLPEYIAQTSRDGVCAALSDSTGIEMPVTVRTNRTTLGQLSAGIIDVHTLLSGDHFPLIIRPLGSHAGKDLEKIEDADSLQAYLERIPSEYFYLSRFVDYRSADGLFRKYRIALIEGRPYVCHFAISSHWMIHYLNAGMGESAEKRAEEAECMAHFDEEFAKRHATALETIYQRMGMQYLGIDCAETQDGNLLIFEIDNAMVVHAMDPADMYPYKKPAMQKVFNAFRQMLENARHKSTANVENP
ncbi:RimK family alpha-L-glutamate ligase [Undibacterium jejuense]|uniref:RimK family alpha-L-glutamate ligase n=1 Tax=Undibacterium jejuense TaxID=1344949 RepID=A0A923HE50_9BURK|nr:RimK family alpha-L-glutamate ligase [Undibacterium jejuense]MBC3861400.1 RimK family alpha-L-glutamate ligase [Undibacterium jejuense]